MKLHTSTHKAEGSGFKAVASFKMDMNAKAARVLSDTLYMDKIGSIIREISCNAFDAHIAVGCPEKPFKIKLPDAFDPTFSVRDFGPGLSHEDIEGIYTTYFGSTKDQDNEAVGAFGLGSKTPFSYTDSFMVTSIHKGVKRIYNAYLEEGLPQISMCGDGVKTDEPDGLEVTVTVEPKDFNEFKQSTIKQLRFFPVKPDVGVQWGKIEKEVAKVENFLYYETDSEAMQGFFIKQGPVAYPVDFDLLRDYYASNMTTSGRRDDPGLTFINFLSNGVRPKPYYYNRIKKHGAYMDMPIGTVEVTASREGISYKGPTLHNICVALDKVRSNMFDTIKHQLDAAFKSSKGEFASFYNSLPDFMLSFLPEDRFNQKYAPFFIERGELHLMLPEKFKDLGVSHYVSAAGKPKKSGCGRMNHGFTGPFKESSFAKHILSGLFKNREVYYKDENYAFVARADLDAEGNNFDIIELPEDKYDAFVKYIDGITDITKISTTAMPTRKTKTTGHSTTGGQNRAWFWINKNFFDRVHHNDLSETLYRYNCDQEFHENIEDYDGDQTLICCPTFNNRLMTEEMGAGKYKMQLVHNYMMYRDNGYRFIGIPEKDMKKAIKKNPSKFVTFMDYYNTNKDSIIKEVRDSIKSAALVDYHQKVERHFRVNHRLYAALHNAHLSKELSKLDDAILSYTDYNSATASSTVLDGINGYVLNEVLKSMDQEKLCDFKDEAIKIITDGESWKKIEDGLTAMGIKVTSVSKNIDSIKAALKNPVNAKPFLNMMVGGDISFTWKIEDIPTLTGTDIMLDPHEIATEIISNIA